MEFRTCFVLRRRSYSETSLLLELLTDESQYVHALYRGAKRNSSTNVDLLTPYSMSWRPHDGLLTIRSCEPGEAIRVCGENLYAVLYLNELIRRGVRQNQFAKGVFEAYESASTGLVVSSCSIAAVLRKFEKRFLRALGFELTFDREQLSGKAITSGRTYRFEPDGGFLQTRQQGERSYSGRELLAIAHDQFDEFDVRRAAKEILKRALDFHLGEASMKASELLIAGSIRKHATHGGVRG